MDKTITIYTFLLSFVCMLPIRGLLPNRYLSNTLDVILDRKGKVKSKNVEATSSRLLRMLQPLFLTISRILRIDSFSPRWYSYKTILQVANMDKIFSVEHFVGFKFFSSISILIYFLLLFSISPTIELLLLALIVSFIGFFLPDQWIKIRIRQRKWKIQKEIPSILISLAVTTDAGLSLQQALEEVCMRKPGELSDEFIRTLQEISVGIPQKEAFENMINRVLVDELTLLISVLIQAMEKGSSGMTRILREQSKEAWIKRKSKAKELGEKASIKLFLPLVGFILPALMIFLIAPAIFTIFRFFEI